LSGTDDRGGRFPFVEPGALKKAVVVCHRNADADSYLSAFALSKLLGAIAPGCVVEIACPEGMTTLTEKLSKSFPHRLAEEPKEYDLYVAVDVGDKELLKEWLPRLEQAKAPRVLVDHHPARGDGPYDHLIVNDAATSAAEVAYGLFEGLGIAPDAETSQALLLGLMFDSSHLAIAGENGLRTAVKLMDAGADVDEARRLLRSEPDYGEVMAKLKGAQRLKIYRLGKWLIGVSKVGSFQAHVARSMLSLGADVSVVGGTTDGETRVSMRSSFRFHDSTKIQLGTDVADAVALQQGGHGGGHATAASFSSNGSEDEAIDAALKRIGGLLGAELQALD
jgi:nanoRNase/pAp phosphatase (c-di-AMP/oligoRNAs hydrolase)